MGKKKSRAAAGGGGGGGGSIMSSSVTTLREEKSGKKQKQSNVNPKSMLKLDHLKSLAIWANNNSNVSFDPSLGAFFGYRYAATAEALGVSPDASLFYCQRCESILQPGYNCTVRIEKIKEKVKRRCKKKPNVSTQNSVVYKCDFCSHQNLMRGTPKGYMKELCSPKTKLPSKSELAKLNDETFAKSKVITTSKDDAISKVDEIASQEMTSSDAAHNSPMTPMTKSLLDMKKRKRNRSGSKKAAEPESSSVLTDTANASIGSSKRKRKSWTSLKDIAERSEQDSGRNFANLSIPFHI